MQQQCTGRIIDKPCPTAPISAAVAVMDFVCWHDPSPLDLHIISFALRRIALSLPPETSTVCRLRSAAESLERAATAWHLEQGLPWDSAPLPIELASAGPIVELPSCSCHEDGGTRATAIGALLENSATAIGRLILTHCASTCLTRMPHDDGTTRNLIHAGAELTAAARSIRVHSHVQCWN